MAQKPLLPIISFKFGDAPIGLTLELIEQAPDQIQIDLLHLTEGQDLVNQQIYQLAQHSYARAIRRGREAERRALATNLGRKFARIYPRIMRWGSPVYRRSSGHLSGPNSHKPFYKFWIRSQHYRKTFQTWREIVTRHSKS